MEMSRDEVEQRLRRAADVRRKLRRASRKLMAFGKQLLEARDAKQSRPR